MKSKREEPRKKQRGKDFSKVLLTGRTISMRRLDS